MIRRASTQTGGLPFVTSNQGDFSAVLKELGSSEGIRNIATSMVTAGVIEGLNSSGRLPGNIAGATNGGNSLVYSFLYKIFSEMLK